MKYIVGPFGARLQIRPEQTAPSYGVIPHGTIIEGEMRQGEDIHNNDRWMVLEVWVWSGRLLRELKDE